MTIAPPPVEAVPLVELLEEVARRLGYGDGHATLSFEFDRGSFRRYKAQHIAGSRWLEEQLGEDWIGSAA